MKDKLSVLKGLAGNLSTPEEAKPISEKGNWQLLDGEWIWVPLGTDGLPLREGKLDIPVVPKMNGK